jgi:tetratricopeptide (TPR) repeat protein/TolB-like protein
MTDLRSDRTLDSLRGALAERYALERVLGAGAMGQVFLARDVTLDRPVAVKVISPELAASATFRDRFLLEARTVAKLRHPNIVAVHAAGEAAGHLYFVMEYVGGESLRDLINREKRVDPDRAARILADVADALAYAHGQGVVHRDVKPENVLLDGHTGRAMLTDFGIARALTAAEDGRLTGTGLLVGSPRYMSPEQASGERALDGRTDIYSLGLVGYEMLVGESPYAGASAASLIAKQVTEPAPSVATQAPGIPRGLAAAIDRALEKDPARRWQDAAMMARALRGDVTSHATHMAGSRPEQRRRWAPAVGALMAVLAAAVAWGLFARPGSGADDGRPSFLIMPFGVIRGDQSLDWLRPGSVDMLTRNLAQWRDIDVVDYEHTLDLLRDANLDGAQTIGLREARELARDGDARTVVLGQIARNGDSLHVVARVYDVESGDLTKEIPVGGLASGDVRWLFDRLANELLGLAGAPTPRKSQVARITTASVEAYRHYLNGARALHAWELDEADSAFRRATEIDSTFALAYYKRSQTHGWRRAADTLSRHYARLAAAHAERLPPRERVLVEGHLDQEEGNYARAQQRFAALLAQDSTDAEAWYGYGDAWFHAPRKLEELAANFTRALRAFNRAIALDSSFHLAYAHVIEIYSQVSAPNFAWIIEGDSVRYLSSEEEARRFGRERIERARARARELAIQTALHWVDVDAAAAPAYQRLADAYAAVRRYDDAIATLQRAMRQPATRYADFPYRIASYQLPRQPAQALATLRDAMRTHGADSLVRRGSAHRFPIVFAAANVAMYTGALGDMDRLFAILAAADPVIPGSVRAGHLAPMTSATGPLRLGVRAMSGIGESRDRRVIDSAIAGLEAIPGPAGPQARGQSWGLAYAGYIISEDPKYLDVIRRWSGSEPPLVLQAHAALAAGDTAQAARLVARIPPPDTARLISPPNQIDDALSRAAVLAAVGQKRAAVRVLESIDPNRFSVLHPDPRWAMYPRSLLERGALYEELGDRAKAAAAYDQYLGLMRNADPVLQPQIRLARTRLNALRDAPAGALTPQAPR